MKISAKGLKIAVLTTVLVSPGVFAGNGFESNNINLTGSPVFSVKGTPTQDSATRTGTENWEQPQGDFFVVPGVILGLAAIILFWKRD